MSTWLPNGVSPEGYRANKKEWEDRRVGGPFSPGLLDGSRWSVVCSIKEIDGDLYIVRTDTGERRLVFKRPASHGFPAKKTEIEQDQKVEA